VLDGILVTVGIVIAFGAFVVWGRTATGQKQLKARFGESHSFQKRQRMAKRRGTGQGAKPIRPTKRSPR